MNIVHAVSNVLQKARDIWNPPPVDGQIVVNDIDSLCLPARDNFALRINNKSLSPGSLSLGSKAVPLATVCLPPIPILYKLEYAIDGQRGIEFLNQKRAIEVINHLKEQVLKNGEVEYLRIPS